MNGRSPNHVESELHRAPRHYSYIDQHDANRYFRNTRGLAHSHGGGDEHKCNACGHNHGPVSSAIDDAATDSPYLWNDLYSLEEGMECCACITRLPHITQREVLREIGKLNTRKKGPNVLASRHVRLPINALWERHNFKHCFHVHLVLNLLFITANCVFSVFVPPGKYYHGSARGGRLEWTWSRMWYCLMIFVLVVLGYIHGRHEFIQLRAEKRRVQLRRKQRRERLRELERRRAVAERPEAHEQSLEPVEGWPTTTAYLRGMGCYLSSGWNWVQLLCVFGSATTVILVRLSSSNL